MPISSQTPIIGYVANGVSTVFTFPFVILSSDDLKVSVNNALVTTGLTITGVGDRDGGTVTFSAPPAAASPIILYREVSLERTTDYQENGDLLAGVLDDDLDRLWAALQDQAVIGSQALRVPVGETVSPIPKASERALKALGFDALGQPIALPQYDASSLAIALNNKTPGDDGAALVGVDDGSGGSLFSTVKGFILKLLSFDGLTLLKYDEEDPQTVEEVLDNAKSMANYTALRAYTGRATGVRITQPGLAGFFQRDDADTTSADNGGTIIVDASGRRWKRNFEGAMFIEWFGADPTGSADSTAPIQSAIASGAKNIYVPPGLYKITSTVTLSTTRDLTFRGAGRDATGFLTTINDGSPVFAISGQWHDIGDFKVTSATGTLQNFIGVRMGRISTSTSFTRSKATGIKVSNAVVGIEVYGWVNDLNLFYTGCTLGVNGKELNSCEISLRGENNVTGFDLTNVYGTTFSNILEENTFTAGATTGTSLIRRGNAITVDSVYLEGGTFSTTVLAFGSGSDFVQGLTVAQIKSSVAPADGSPAVLFDRVQGVCVEGVITNDNRGAVSFGTEARAIQPQLFTYSANPTANTITNSFHDNSRQIRRAENWFGDTFLYRTLATFDTVTKTSVTTSNYVDLFITGKQSLRIISGTGVASTSLAVRRTASNFPGLVNLAGRRIKMFAWVYVPNLTKFADRTYQPAIQISVGGGGSASSTSQRTCAHGGWNLVETPGITIPAGWTGTGSDYLELKFFVNDTANTVVDAGYYILIDSIFVTDRDVSILDIQRGNWIDVPLMGVSTDGDRLTVRSDNFTTVVNGDAAIKVGDQVLAWTPTAGGFVGRVCTTAGALGSTAVFKTFGAVSA